MPDRINPKRTFARKMRSAPTSNEAALWKLLRGRRLENLKFRRQVLVGSYIADFLCYRHRLIIEADGPFHEHERDEKRDAWLRGEGFRVIRFSNEMIATNKDAVLAEIVRAVEAPGTFGGTPCVSGIVHDEVAVG
jgi:very-short-patch-repair endonuclease